MRTGTTNEKNLEEKFRQLKKTISDYYSKKPDFKKVDLAWEFANIAHTGQKRLSGEPYVSHGLETALILADWKLDLDSIVTGILHDTVEDGGATREDVLEKFGLEISDLVDGVTKISGIRLKGSTEEIFVENLRKMFLAMAKDLRVVLVKLADRLHNIRTLGALPLEKQVKIARETLEIYAPLAERLGMGEIKGELEDVCFSYVYPDIFKKLNEDSRVYFKRVNEVIEKMRRVLLAKLADEKISAKINGRKKHLYSLWKKLQRPEINGDFENIFDIVALRILVSDIPDCYSALGIVHLLFKPALQFGFSDFIAQPKPNGYRSIHTKVFGPGGRIVEIQIRTYQMHDEAEYGIAAHWVYSESKSKGVKDRLLEEGEIFTPDEKLSWVKQLADWQKEINDSKEYLEAVKFDALSHRNFVFSPKGDVFDLPIKATPVDYAFLVHSDLGNFIKGAKVNGKIVPLDYQLKSGDVVEIIKTKEPQKPSLKWLDFVVTTVAKKEIKKLISN